MTKDMIRASLHYDFKLDMNDQDFESLYEAAASCVREGIVKVRSWSTPFRPGDCDNPIVKEVGAMVLRGEDLDHIVPQVLRRHYMLREGSRYRVLTQRDVEYAYDVAIMCLRDKAERARRWSSGAP